MNQHFDPNRDGRRGKKSHQTKGRQLDEAAIQGLRASALHYQDNMRRFRTTLDPVRR